MNTAGLALYFGMRFAKGISMEIANVKVKEQFIQTASNIREAKAEFPGLQSSFKEHANVHVFSEEICSFIGFQSP